MATDREVPPTVSKVCQNYVFDTILELARLTSPPQVVATLAGVTAKFGFTAWGICGLPPPAQGADPLVLTESTPEGFRDFYIHERFYLVNHIAAHARIAAEPFRFSEAPYDTRESRGHQRFMQALETYGLAKGFIVPVGRQAHLPVCVWLAGAKPDLHDDAIGAIQLIALFAAAKSYALATYADEGKPVLTAREREVMIWTARGKSAWEIGEILGIAKRTVDAHAQAASGKFGAANKTQAAVFAILRNIIEI